MNARSPDENLGLDVPAKTGLLAFRIYFGVNCSKGAIIYFEARSTTVVLVFVSMGRLSGATAVSTAVGWIRVSVLLSNGCWRDRSRPLTP